jgi:hypothetical protein
MSWKKLTPDSHPPSNDGKDYLFGGYSRQDRPDKWTVVVARWGQIGPMQKQWVVNKLANLSDFNVNWFYWMEIDADPELKGT